VITIDRLMRRLRNFALGDIRLAADAIATIERERYIKELLREDRYADPRTLGRFGFKVYSQNDEDGIIQEIFARIGTVSKSFVEFGVETGMQNNTLKLLLEGWNGLWLEGSEDYVRSIQTRFADVIAERRLHASQAFIDRDNINALIGTVFQDDIDLISIDIDGNDIYILEALEIVRPRVVVIEYNGKFPPPMNLAQVYNPTHRWRGTDYGGSSLVAITKVAERKGYALVGCNMTGINAFFVRTDLLGDKFCPPWTAEHHFEPARIFLSSTFIAGHAADWGPYVSM
jgi:hypothetical protein